MRLSLLRLCASLATASLVTGCTLTADLEGVDRLYGAGAGGLGGLGGGGSRAGSAGAAGLAGKSGAGGQSGASGNAGAAGNGGAAGSAGVSGMGGSLAGTSGASGNGGFGGSVVVGGTGGGGSGGAAGNAGTAGKAGSGGSAGNAGNAGSAGKSGGGDAGNAGTSGAGQGGTAGAAGQAGQAGKAGAGGAPPISCNSPSDCPAAPVCQVNACVGNLCGTAPSPVGSPCPDDADKCNGVEQCNGQGACLHVNAPVVADAFACTVDTCDPSTGQITHAPTGVVPDDGNACSVESCSATAGPQHIVQNSERTCIGAAPPKNADFDCGKPGYVVSSFDKCEDGGSADCCDSTAGYRRTCRYLCQPKQTFCPPIFGGPGNCPLAWHPVSGPNCCLTSYTCNGSGSYAFECSPDTDSFTSCGSSCPTGWHITSTGQSGGACAPSQNAGGGIGFQTKCDKDIGEFTQCGINCPTATHKVKNTILVDGCPDGAGGPGSINGAICEPK